MKKVPTELELLYDKRRSNILLTYALSEQIAELEARRRETIADRDKLDLEIIRVRHRSTPIVVGS